MRVALTFAIIILMVSANAARAGIITNGSFEDPVRPVGSITNFLGGSTAITGWTVIGVDSTITSTAFTQSGITFNAQDGNQWLDLAGINSNSPSSGIMQTVSTVIGASYDLSFYVGSATDGRFFFPATVDLTIDNGSRVSFMNPNAPTNALDWKLFTVSFTAQNALTTFKFQNGSASNNYLTALDNVSVTLNSVPEPSTFSIFAMSFAIASLSQLRRIRKKD